VSDHDAAALVERALLEADAAVGKFTRSQLLDFYLADMAADIAADPASYRAAIDELRATGEYHALTIDQSWAKYVAFAAGDTAPLKSEQPETYDHPTGLAVTAAMLDVFGRRLPQHWIRAYFVAAVDDIHTLEGASHDRP